MYVHTHTHIHTCQPVGSRTVWRPLHPHNGEERRTDQSRRTGTPGEEWELGRSKVRNGVKDISLKTEAEMMHWTTHTCNIQCLNRPKGSAVMVEDYLPNVAPVIKISHTPKYAASLDWEHSRIVCTKTGRHYDTRLHSIKSERPGSKNYPALQPDYKY